MLTEAHRQLAAARQEAEQARHERDTMRATLEASLRERDGELAHLRNDVLPRLQVELQSREERLDRLTREQSALLSSSSWKMTAPFRLLARSVRRLTATGAQRKDSTAASR